MPKLLVAVKSCQYDKTRGAHSLVREMWGRQIKDSDVRFFTARPQRQPEHDEVIVDARHLLFEHRHHTMQKRPKDLVDEAHSSDTRWRTGEALFNLRRSAG